MKILLLPTYFIPERVSSSYLGDNRNQAFAAAGYTMEAYVPMPSRSISHEVRKQYKNRRTEIICNGSLTVHRFQIFPEGRNPLLRAFRYFLCSTRQFLFGYFAKGVDVIYISSTPPIQGMMVALLKYFKQIPFVYTLQDIFPDSLVATGLTRKGSLLWKMGRVIEDFTYRNADKIIVISEGFKKNIMDKGVPESKIEVIYNWVDENAVLPLKREKNIMFDKYELDKDKFYITYSGNIGLTQNMDLLIRVAVMLKKIDKIHFVLIGEGAYKQEVEKQIMENRLENISLLPFQPYEDISHVFSLGDVGLVISKENVGQNSVPSKTWSIMSAARPVLASFDENSELHDIIGKNNAGIFVKAGDQEALSDAIFKLYNNPGLGKEMGKNGRNFILKNLTREIGTSKYVNVLRSVLKK